MFAAFPGDIVFSKIDARSGAIGVIPTEIAKAVVTSEFPVFIPDPDRLDGLFVKLIRENWRVLGRPTHEGHRHERA
jgi:type I restriction enzyme, S subunit